MRSWPVVFATFAGDDQSELCLNDGMQMGLDLFVEKVKLLCGTAMFCAVGGAFVFDLTSSR